MNKLITLMLAFGLNQAVAQSQTVIRANSPNAVILEGQEEVHAWRLSPEARPDVFTINKSPKGKLVRFCTDTDTLGIVLKPGQKHDFVVLYQGKDSCYTRLQSPSTPDYSKLRPEQHDTIPFVLTEFNNIKVQAILDGTDTLDLKFDSGTTGVLLTEEAIRTKTKLGKNTMEPVHSLQIGNLHWDKQGVYPVKLSGQGTDGRFGWDLFDGKILEIDYDNSRMVLHSRLPRKPKGYASFPIEYIHTLFCIQGELQLKDQKYGSRFLFDNGYQRTIMLDTLILQAQGYPRDLPLIKKTIMKTGQGKEIPVLTVNNEQLNFGPFTLPDVPAQVLATANPAGFRTHILGGEVLKRFNTFIDFRDNIVYLKPSRLYADPYTDAR